MPMKVCACSGRTRPKSGELRTATSVLVRIVAFVYDTQLTIEQVLSALEEQPKTIARLTNRLGPGQLRHVPANGEWSLNDVLAHLRACADMWGKYMALIAEQDHPTFRAVNPRTWIDSTNYPDLEFEASFRAYRAQRTQLVKFLRSLAKAQWSRSATVTGGGSPRERTVLEYARWLANHERSHLRQIVRLSEAVRDVSHIQG